LQCVVIGLQRKLFLLEVDWNRFQSKTKKAGINPACVSKKYVVYCLKIAGESHLNGFAP